MGYHWFATTQDQGQMTTFVKKAVTISTLAIDAASAEEFVTGVSTWTTDANGNPAPLFDNSLAVFCTITDGQDWGIVLVRNGIDSTSDYVDTSGNWHGKFYYSNQGSNPDGVVLKFDVNLEQ